MPLCAPGGRLAGRAGRPGNGWGVGRRVNGGLMKKFFVFFLGILFLFPAAGFCATDFFDLIKFGISGGTVKDVDAKLYNSRTRAAFNDPDLDGNLDTGETMLGTVRIYDRKGKLVLESPADLTRTQLALWALQNSDLLLETIFEGNLSQATGQSSDALLARSTFNLQILEKLDPTRNELTGVLQYEHLDVIGEKGDAGGLLVGYSWGFDSGATLGLAGDYRYTQMDDGPGSQSDYGSLDLYYKHPVGKWGSTVWSLGLDAFGTVYALKSTSIDKLGNLSYGGGAFTSLSFRLSSVLVSAGLEYKVSDASVPDSLVDSDDAFLAKVQDYINDLSAVQTLTYGLNVGIPIADTVVLNLEALRSQFISDDIPDDRKAQTAATARLAWLPNDDFELSFGVHTILELSDIDAYGADMKTIFRF